MYDYNTFSTDRTCISQGRIQGANITDLLLPTYSRALLQCNRPHYLPMVGSHP